jgi:hypothetical protein
MRQEHDERVSNERLNALAYVDKYENLALTRADGSLVLRFHTARGRVHRPDPRRLPSGA